MFFENVVTRFPSVYDDSTLHTLYRVSLSKVEESILRQAFGMGNLLGPVTESGQTASFMGQEFHDSWVGIQDEHSHPSSSSM
jgi:hypothetical protein